MSLVRQFHLGACEPGASTAAVLGREALKFASRDRRRTCAGLQPGRLLVQTAKFPAHLKFEEFI